MSPNSYPNRIKRVGVVVELQDGRRVMWFSDDPHAEVEIKSEREQVGNDYGIGYPTRMLSPMLHSITISNLSTYTMQYTEPEQTATAIDGIKNTIERAPKEEA